MPALHERYLTETIGADGHPTGFSLTCPDDFSFGYDVVDELARRSPDKRALRWTDDDGDVAEYTFGDISRLSDQAAAYFLQAGVRKGDRVLLILKRHAQFWWAIVALHKIGAVAVPATNQLKTHDLHYRLRKAEIRAVVATMEGDVADAVDEAAADLGLSLIRAAVHGGREGWDDFDAGVAAAPPFVAPAGADRPLAADPLLLYFTSGTTAEPKMVLHDHSYPIAHIPTARYWQRVDPDGLHLTVSETGWAKSVWGKLYGQWLMEAAVDVFDFDRFDPKAMLQHLHDARVTTFCAPPTIYRFLVAEDLSGYDLSNLRHATTAGEAMNPAIVERFRELTGLELKEGYGQTEMTLAAFTAHWQTGRPGSMGTPSPAYDVVLLREDGTVAGPGEEAEICVRADRAARPLGLFLGYADDDAITDAVWRDGYYHTHDLATSDEDGYLWYVGRTDDMIKTSGYRVGPFEVESIVLDHPAVIECAITGVPDEIRGTVIKATIVLDTRYPASPELGREIQRFVKSRTAPYKYPRVVEFVDALPKTISGKVRRVELRHR